MSSQLRAQFPALVESQSRPVCYFDNAATAFMPASVRQAICDFYDRAHGSVHRAIYTNAEHTTSEHERTRIKVQHFLNAASHKEIIFTGGATDSLNAVAHMWAMNNLKPGDRIITTQAEHHAHYVLWQEMAKRTGAKLYILPLDPHTFTVDLSDLDTILDGPVKLMAVSIDSNVLGPIWGESRQLLAQLIAGVRQKGGIVILDAAQLVAHEKVDVQSLDCDFLAFSAHKMGGQPDWGVLYARQALHESMTPYRFGGGMVAAVSQECSTGCTMRHSALKQALLRLHRLLAIGALLDFYRTEVDFTSLLSYEAQYNPSCGDKIMLTVCRELD